MRLAAPGLVVTAPVGNDVFYVAAYATANPVANAVTGAIYESGSVSIGGANTRPLNFSLNAVPAVVELAVPSPDPGNTPNAQTFDAGTPTSVPLGINVYDAAGNIVLADATTQSDPPTVAVASPEPSARRTVRSPRRPR